MTEIKLNSTDDLENLKLVEAKLKEKIEILFNRDELIYLELKFKLIELAENLTTEAKIKFILYLDDIKLSVEDIIQLMPSLFTHCITHLIIKKIVFELYELKKEIRQNEDITKIYEKLNLLKCSVSLDISNDDKPQPPPQPVEHQLFKPKRKPRAKKPIKIKNETEPTPTPKAEKIELKFY
jgi:hypothetical protein